MATADEYRRGVRAKHHEAFVLWGKVARTYRDAMAVPRKRDTDLRIVLDMLMLQSANAHDAVSLVAEHGLYEDAATLARRLLELSIQATYIAKDDDPKVRARRAGTYLAFLWRKLPAKGRRLLPALQREEWSQTAKSYGRFVRKSAKQWGRSFKVMFEECNAGALYTSDYAFLSSAAHGSSADQIVRFGRSPIPAHDDRHVSILLVYASKYLAVVGEHWNELFGIVPPARIAALRTELAGWRFLRPKLGGSLTRAGR
jgi:hypothetical protein